MTNKAKIYEAINNLPVFDVHTHIDGEHAAARGLNDIRLYDSGKEIYA